MKFTLFLDFIGQSPSDLPEFPHTNKAGSQLVWNFIQHIWGRLEVIRLLSNWDQNVCSIFFLFLAYFLLIGVKKYWIVFKFWHIVRQQQLPATADRLQSS